MLDLNERQKMAKSRLDKFKLSRTIIYFEYDKTWEEIKKQAK